MKDFLILILVFSASVTFAQNKMQAEPVKPSIESEDIKEEIKEVPASDVIKPEGELEKIEEAIEEELELLEEETEDVKEMKEEEEAEIIEEEGVKEKLKIETEKDPKVEDE